MLKEFGKKDNANNGFVATEIRGNLGMVSNLRNNLQEETLRIHCRLEIIRLLGESIHLLPHEVVEKLVCDKIESIRIEQELRLQNEKLNKETIIDEMTGLFNKNYLNNTIRKEIKNAKRNGHNISCLMIDGDKFKAINDTHGHLIGDKVIKHIGEIIKSVVRDSDIPASIPSRFGGDEFCIVCPDTGLNGADILKVRLTNALIENPFVNGDIKIDVSISVGISCLDANIFNNYSERLSATDIEYIQENLLKCADENLYKIKHGKKG